MKKLPLVFIGLTLIFADAACQNSDDKKNKAEDKSEKIYNMYIKCQKKNGEVYYNHGTNRGVNIKRIDLTRKERNPERIVLNFYDDKSNSWKKFPKKECKCSATKFKEIKPQARNIPLKKP